MRKLKSGRKGEIATTHAAARQGILQILSFSASKSLEEVMAAREEGQEVGWQLYLNSDRSVALHVLFPTQHTS